MCLTNRAAHSAEAGRDGHVQVGKKGWEQADVAAGPLFVSVQPAALQGRRTYAAFTALLDNYERCEIVGTQPLYTVIELDAQYYPSRLADACTPNTFNERLWWACQCGDLRGRRDRRAPPHGSADHRADGGTNRGMWTLVVAALTSKASAGRAAEIAGTRRETGRAERTTQQEAGEEHAFLEAVTASRPMQYVHQYLAAKVPGQAAPLHDCFGLVTSGSSGHPIGHDCKKYHSKGRGFILVEVASMWPAILGTIHST